MNFFELCWWIFVIYVLAKDSIANDDRFWSTNLWWRLWKTDPLDKWTRAR